MVDERKDLQNIKPIPEPTLRRLPVYYQYLKKIHNERKVDFISATQIGNELKIIPIQVRKDLEITEITGRPKLGYNVTELIKRIEDFLGWNNVTDAFLVGAGNLGSALLGYNGFKEYGLNIVAGFDDDENKVGREIGGKMIFHVDRLPEMIRRMGIKIGILTVPAAYAQDVANTMIKAGIRAIWNFTHIKLNVPANIIVQHENLAASLVVLSKRLEILLQAQK
ncbi:MAG: redox-sensing transcriptional repressor Rex [Syntrophorhabdaceae bacterium]|nr:redox-sensing transcriptional repressor Rex [Syntrophorhabdaceae bacterium]